MGQVSTNRKIAFIHGRPGPHPMHRRFAESVNADFVYVDFKIRWHDLASSRLRRYLSWLVCALSFPNKSKYDFFLTECVCFPPVIMKWLKLLTRKQKVIALMADESLYFLYTNRYSKITSIMTKKWLRSLDAVICVGKMEEDLLRRILGDETPPVYTIINGITPVRFNKLKTVNPSLDTHNIIFIANGPSGWRSWYKGLDLLLSVFEKLSVFISDLTLTVVGKWDSQYIIEQMELYCPNSKDKVNFVGLSDNLEYYLQNSSLYLHCARGEAYGITVLEAMAAGVVPIVSEWTGAKEAVHQIDDRLICSLKADEIVDRVIWYFQLSMREKHDLSKKAREISYKYQEDKTLIKFQNTFSQIARDLL